MVKIRVYVLYFNLVFGSIWISLCLIFIIIY